MDVELNAVEAERHSVSDGNTLNERDGGGYCATMMAETHTNLNTYGCLYEVSQVHVRATVSIFCKQLRHVARDASTSRQRVVNNLKFFRYLVPSIPYFGLPSYGPLSPQMMWIKLLLGAFCRWNGQFFFGVT